MNELANIEQLNTMELFTTKNGLDDYLMPLKNLVESFEPDVTTDKGIKEIKSFCYKLARVKTKIDGVGKDLVSDLKKKPKLIDAERKRVRDLIDLWSSSCREPLTKMEEAEAERVSEIQGNIRVLEDILVSVHATTSREQMNETVKIIKDSVLFEAHEFTQKKDGLVSDLREAVKNQGVKIDEAEEAARLQRSKDDAEREARYKQEKIDAERRAEEARIEEAKAKEDAEKFRIEAEKLKIEAQEKAKIEEKNKERREEIERAQKEKEDAEKRAKDERHAKSVLIEINEALKIIIPSDMAKKVTIALSNGEIPNLEIKY